jgi:hypothetical protein
MFEFSKEVMEFLAVFISLAFVLSLFYFGLGKGPEERKKK